MENGLAVRRRIDGEAPVPGATSTYGAVRSRDRLIRGHISGRKLEIRVANVSVGGVWSSAALELYR